LSSTVEGRRCFVETPPRSVRELISVRAVMCSCVHLGASPPPGNGSPLLWAPSPQPPTSGGWIFFYFIVSSGIFFDMNATRMPCVQTRGRFQELPNRVLFLKDRCSHLELGCVGVVHVSFGPNLEKISVDAVSENWLPPTFPVGEGVSMRQMTTIFPPPPSPRVAPPPRPPARRGPWARGVPVPGGHPRAGG